MNILNQYETRGDLGVGNVDFGRLPFSGLFLRAFQQLGTHTVTIPGTDIFSMACRCLIIVDSVWPSRTLASLEQASALAAEFLKCLHLRIRGTDSAPLEDDFLSLCFMLRKLDRCVRKESSAKKVFGWGVKPLWCRLILVRRDIGEVLDHGGAYRETLTKCRSYIGAVLKSLLARMDVMDSQGTGPSQRSLPEKGPDQMSTGPAHDFWNMISSELSEPAKDEEVRTSLVASLPWLVAEASTTTVDGKQTVDSNAPRVKALHFCFRIFDLLQTTWNDALSEETRDVYLKAISGLLEVISTNRWYRSSESFAKQIQTLATWLIDIIESGNFHALGVLAKLLELDIERMDSERERLVSLLLKMDAQQEDAASLLCSIFRGSSNSGGFSLFTLHLMNSLLSSPKGSVNKATVIGHPKCRSEFSKSIPFLTTAEQVRLVEDLAKSYFETTADGTPKCSAKKLQGSLTERLTADFLIRSIVATEHDKLHDLKESILTRACDMGVLEKSPMANSCARIIGAACWSLRWSHRAATLRPEAALRLAKWIDFVLLRTPEPPLDLYFHVSISASSTVLATVG